MLLFSAPLLHQSDALSELAVVLLQLGLCRADRFSLVVQGSQDSSGSAPGVKAIVVHSPSSMMPLIA